ncbi:MAG: transposase, partial [Planctomycetota bacterium]
SVDRRQFEVCVFSQVALEMKAGDLCIVGSDRFSDYREQLVSWQEYDESIGPFCEQVGLDVDGSTFVNKLRQLLEERAEAADQSFPDNKHVHIEDGEAVVKKPTRGRVPASTKQLNKLIADMLPPLDILDVITDAEKWVNWTRFFGPMSGHDAKIDDSVARYVTTAFCYRCGLGPTQTARSLRAFDRRQLAWVNQRHVTEKGLEEAITELVNTYNRFRLPKLWGSGKRASADGTKWDLYEQNLLSEYHIRYGGYGGIGYYHVSDTYIALFSHFIPCGVWEAVYILDGLMNNESEIQPDTLHADTQGQNLPVFGLSHLLGIKLMPRIRNWKKLKLFRPSRESCYSNIDELFSDCVDWKLIETHLPDMLRVALSVKAGRITASTLLRKLGTYSRKNRLYVAMRELGRVVRTAFLLEYLGDIELRRVIHAATNKSEAFNRFAKWVSFGGDATIRENDRDKQRKLIKYNHLVANCLILHNVDSMTKILHRLMDDGHEIDDSALAHMSPYITEHINRFGDYELNLARATAPPEFDLEMETAGTGPLEVAGT